MLFDGDLLLDMEMTIYEDLMVKCGGFSVTLSGSHFQFRTPFTSVASPRRKLLPMYFILSGTSRNLHTRYTILIHVNVFKITDSYFDIILQ